MPNIKIFILIFTVSVLGIFSSCNEDEEKGQAYVSFILTDNPADYDSVIIDIIGVSAHVEEEEDWIELTDVNTGAYNLLEFTAGADTLLAGGFLPAGEMTEIRLLLGDNNYIVENGQKYPLKTPSAQQSGYKIKLDETLNANFTYSFILDFDAARSIVEAGNSGQRLLKPVVHATLDANSGAITGVVDPITESPVIYAVTGTDSLSTFPDDAGIFLFRGVSEATYDLVFIPDTGSAFDTTYVNDVVVTIGQVSDVETVSLNEAE